MLEEYLNTREELLVHGNVQRCASPSIQAIYERITPKKLFDDSGLVPARMMIGVVWYVLHSANTTDTVVYYPNAA